MEISLYAFLKSIDEHRCQREQQQKREIAHGDCNEQPLEPARLCYRVFIGVGFAAGIHRMGALLPTHFWSRLMESNKVKDNTNMAEATAVAPA